MMIHSALAGLILLGLTGSALGQAQVPPLGRPATLEIGRAPSLGTAGATATRNVPIDVEKYSVAPIQKPKLSLWQRMSSWMPKIHQRKEVLMPSDVGLTPVMTKKTYKSKELPGR